MRKNISRRSLIKSFGGLSLPLMFGSKSSWGHDNKVDDTRDSNYGKDLDALIVVDVQNDFCPGGSLPVDKGNKIIPIINKLQKKFNNVFYTQDWHPKDHSSFSTNNPGQKAFTTIDMYYGKQVIWPPHCIFNTKGAEFHKDLDTTYAKTIIRKGYRKEIDSYSGFFENDRKTPTGLKGILDNLKLKRVFICGLALDFCVNYTALDAKKLGFDTIVIENATYPVNIGDSVTKTLDGFKRNNIGYGKVESFI